MKKNIVLLFINCVLGLTLSAQKISIYPKIGVQHNYPKKTKVPAVQSIETSAPYKPYTGYSFSLQANFILREMKNFYVEAGYAHQGATDIYVRTDKYPLHYAFVEAGFISFLPWNFDFSLGLRGAYLFNEKVGFLDLQTRDGSVSAQLSWHYKRWAIYSELNQSFTYYYESTIPNWQGGEDLHFTYRNRFFTLGVMYRVFGNTE